MGFLWLRWRVTHAGVPGQRRTGICRRPNTRRVKGPIFSFSGHHEHELRSRPATGCKAQRNLNSSFAIIMGLNTAAVSRLNQTWEKDTISSLFTPSSPNLMGSPVLCSVQWVCMTTDGSLTTVMKNKPGKETVQMQKSGDIPKNLVILETGL
ncbi:rap guanine nucleotide exchange factor 5 [Labeo rohita]|uniref:Rap guanine nucleotide exchange factor 5 n=1 Tax=Labeo rohita TaxID=84645 RepID=A0A498LSW7_LABRO|nr:rap guanine nucleotide exchange factor 5 [Labeo rohita]